MMKKKNIVSFQIDQKQIKKDMVKVNILTRKMMRLRKVLQLQEREF